MVTALLFASIAHTSHLHAPEAQGRSDALHCGLCLQLQRLVAVPSAAIRIAPAHVIERPVALPVAGVQLEPTPSLYDARGPPRC